MEVKKVLFISQEIHPYLPETTMSRLCRIVPQGLQESGIEVRTFMPKYGCINERRNELHEVIRLSGVNLIIDDTDHPLVIKVATLKPTRMQVYFIDNDDYFHHHASSQLEIVTHKEDNDERAIFFARGVVETVRKLRWFPEIIHCAGWVSAINPLYIKTKYADDPAFRNAKVVFSLFGKDFDDVLSPRMSEKLIMDGIPADALAAITAGDIDFDAINKLGIDHADAIVAATDDVPQSLIDYAIASGKPFLPFPGLDNARAYADFYQAL